MIKKDNIKSFSLGILTYFVVSVILELLNCDSLIVKIIFLLVIALVCFILNSLLKKKDINS